MTTKLPDLSAEAAIQNRVMTETTAGNKRSGLRNLSSKSFTKNMLNLSSKPWTKLVSQW
jgi:2-oxo-4-hydroxy-4-carboxy--5-ureidoimidazoline (OHCU) decarboxylase